MLPGALFTTYRQYKEDTKIVIAWLAGTARRCGYELVTTDTTGPKGTKPKGKTKKSARDAAGAAKRSQNNPTKDYVVKTRELIPMAQKIADSVDVKVIIPLTILKTWKSCIAARSTTAKWYETDTTAGANYEESNQGHAFFIDVLKRALQILVPIAKLQELDSNRFKLAKSAPEPKEPTEAVSNRFTHLEIQDIDEEQYEILPDVVNEPKTSSDSTAPKPRFSPEELSDTDEYLFALHCFMTDVGNLQDQLKDCWASYAEAEIDLTTAAVTTNVAIEMVKRAEEDFRKIKKPDFIMQIGYSELPWAWFAECCQRDGVTPEKFTDNRYFVPMDAWEQAQESYLHLHRFLVVYSNGVVPGLTGRDRIFAITRPAYYGTYNPELEWDEITPQRQYEQVAALVNDMLATVGGFVMLGETPNDDMLMRGISELQQNQIEPPFWLLFAVQNFVNVHLTLKTKSERPYEELRDFALSARRTLKEHQAFLSKHPLTQMRSPEDEAAVHETLREIEEWVLEDKMKQIMNNVQQMGSTKKRRVWQDFEVMRMSPVLCGMLKYCFHIQMQWKGITLINDTGLVTAAHLYNALQQNGYLGKKNLVWEDMEYLLDLHKAEDTFMGERPRSVEECTRRLALVQGVAPSTFARRRRGNNYRVLRSRAGSRFLSPSTPVAQILGQKYLASTESDWHLDQLDTIVGRKFEKDIKSMKEYGEKMDAKVDGVDVSTYEGKMKILDIFAPNSDILSKVAEHTGTSVMSLRTFFAQRALEANGLFPDAKWAVAVQRVLDEIEDDEAEEEGAQAQYGDVQEKTTKAKGSDAKSSSNKETRAEVRAPKASDALLGLEGESMLSPAEAMSEIIERWQKSKTLPIDIFIDIVRDSLEFESLDIQFDYFAFFRSAFSLMLELHKELSPYLRPRLVDEDSRAAKMFDLNEGAVCVTPQLALLVACDPFKAPNIIRLRPWLEVDLRPLQAAARIMRPWIEENGDAYCATEEEREDKRTESILKEGPKVKYVDDEAANDQGKKERSVGWSSSVGLIHGMNAREMREIFDAMRETGPMGETVAETMARIKGLELDEEDKKLIELRSRVKDEQEKDRNTRGKAKAEELEKWFSSSEGECSDLD